jgi:parallel beta-helix repeat protein
MCALAGILVVGVFAGDYTDVSVAEAKTMIDQRPWLVILDVRNESEYDAGHIRNAVLIPVWQLAPRLNELDKTDEILVYCKKGGRSATASLTLADNGFSHVYNMLEGIDKWVNLTYPVYVKYASIQEAINNATTGEIVNVSAGHYYEHLTINKTLTLQGENVSTTVIDGNGGETVVDVASENVTIVGFTIQGSGCGCAGYAGVDGRSSSRGLNLTGNFVAHNGFGIRLYGTSNVVLSHNTIINSSYAAVEITFSFGTSIIRNSIVDNDYGLDLYSAAANSIIVGNNITGNGYYDIRVRQSSDGNVFTENEITSSITGVKLYSSSSNNTFDANHFRSNRIGVDIENSSGNFFYQNNFAENDQHVLTDDVSINTWDRGNVTGGNYWDIYSGSDSNHDGIGDSPQILGSGNQDNYPLMGAFSTFTTTAGDRLSVTSNSTVEDLQYDSSGSTIRMRVTNMTKNQQNGFCRLTIPHDVLPPPYAVTINNNPANCTTIFENATMSIIYFSYQHSTVEILVIPEYTSFVFLAVAGGAIILSFKVRRTKRTRNCSAAPRTRTDPISLRTCAS